MVVAGPRGGEPVSASAPAAVEQWEFDLSVEAEADAEATPEQLAILEADRAAWRGALVRLVREAEEHLDAVRSLQGEERDQVLADARQDHQRLATALARLDGKQLDDDHGAEANAAASLEPGVVQVQVSWEPGRVVAWAAGPRTPTAESDELLAMLAAAGAPTSPWVPRGSVPVAGGASADAFAAPVGEVLGWLVAAGAGQVDGVGPSVHWLGRVAIWAVELTAKGAMVPVLRQRKRRGGPSNSSRASFSVRWTPALVDFQRLHQVAGSMPGSVGALDPTVDARALTRSALTGMVDAICRDSARRIEVPAAPPIVRTGNDVREAFLARLDGSAFDAPLRVAGELATRAEDWARSVTRDHSALVIRLDPPDRGDAWELAVFAPGPKGALTPIEHAIVNSGSDRRMLDDEMARLERMLPALQRPGSTRRGQAVLSQDEAWELMTVLGPRLAAAGFDVRVPELSLHRPKPMLRVFADSTSSTAVGASQLADVRWSALFDDVELSAADIARLAKEARPSSARVVAGSRSTALISTPRRPRSRSAPQPPDSRAPTCSASPWVSRGRHSPVGSPSPVGVGRQTCSRRLRTSRANRPTLREGSLVNCGVTRRRRSRGCASSIRRASGDAWPSTWDWGRRRPCWRTCWRASAPDRRS